MKIIDKIYDRFPKVQLKIQNKNVILNNTEFVFYQLVKFMSDLDNYPFPIDDIKKIKTKRDRTFALDSIYSYFIEKKLIHDKFQSKQKLFNQTMLADYGKEKGYDTYLSKITTYYSRGKLPTPDIKINKTPYWYQSTVDDYLKTLPLRKKE